MRKYKRFFVVISAFVVMLMGFSVLSTGAFAQDDESEDSSDVFMEDSVSFTDLKEAQAFCVAKTIDGVKYSKSKCVKRMELLNDGGQALVAHLEDGPAVAVKIPEGYFAQLWACKTKKDLPYYVVGPSLIHRTCQMSVRKYDIYDGEQPDPDSYIYVPPVGGTNGTTNSDSSDQSGSSDTGDDQSDTNTSTNAVNSEADSCTLEAVNAHAPGNWNPVTDGGFQGTADASFTIPEHWSVNTPNGLISEGNIPPMMLVTVYPCAR